MHKGGSFFELFRALLKLFALFAAFWFCIANVAAPCLDVKEPKSSGAIGFDLSMKDMVWGGHSGLAFEVKRPVNYFALRRGKELIFEASCDDEAVDCMPKKFRIHCSVMEDVTSEPEKIIAKVGPNQEAEEKDASCEGAEGEDAAEEIKPADHDAEAAEPNEISLSRSAFEACSTEGLFRGPDYRAKVRSSDGKEGVMTFKVVMVPAPGYLGCQKSDYRKCSKKYE